MDSKINILENIEFKSLKPEEKKKIDEYIKKHKKIEEEKNNLNKNEEKKNEQFNHEIENNYKKKEIEEKEENHSSNSEDLNFINLDDQNLEKKNSNEDSDSLEDEQLKEFITNDCEDNNSENNGNDHSDNYDNKMKDIKIKFIYENNPKYNETEYFKYEDDPNLMTMRVFEKHGDDILNIKLYYMNGEEIIINPNNDLCIGEFMKGKNKILIKN